jgi:hypothetical protein
MLTLKSFCPESQHLCSNAVEGTFESSQLTTVDLRFELEEGRNLKEY